MKNIKNTTTLNNGIEMPWLGFGTYNTGDKKTVINAVKTALKIGYRHIDTASFYNNEDAICDAIKESEIPRNEIFLTSKVWNSDQGYENALKAFKVSLKKLDTDYLDLYIIHWPQPLNKETWKALEKLYKDGYVRAIGVSNFTIKHLENLISTAEIAPMVNQIEFHPQLVQYELMKFCQKHDIQIEAWSPLMRGKVFEMEPLKALSKKYSKSISQIVLRWNLQMGVVTIPKSSNSLRIKENTDIFDFQINKEDMLKIKKLNTLTRLGLNPEEVYNHPKLQIE
ncbi:aldo/keto reductase [Clostridium sp. 19966]|uniref:aldo/keto reductase n=1 Tax=Clostridium sp. 19966 TaxID=2768166 RepID=UPI0028DE09C4|nr:aldo/keto reductase [Clostridium sp. 19966]MDT8717529.1 aldo/keto reductase [Clostridium sp. 19966]